MSEDEHSGAESDGELAVYERHRAIVRETDKRFSSMYGYGGAAVLAVSAAVVAAVAWLSGGLWTALPWVLAFTVALISLFALSVVVRRRRAKLRESIEKYCKINEIEVSALREYYARDGIYPYFDDLFADRERVT